jgi:hypothetical protein
MHTSCMHTLCTHIHACCHRSHVQAHNSIYSACCPQAGIRDIYIYIYIHVYSHTLDTCNVSQVAYLGILLCTHTPTHTFVHKCMHAQATVIMIVLAFSVLFYVKYQNATRDWGDTLTGFRYQVRNVKYCNCQTRN